MEAIRTLSPDAVIVDSIQVVETDSLSSAPGSIGQVRACAHELTRLVKEKHSALFLVGHVTKEGHRSPARACWSTWWTRSSTSRRDPYQLYRVLRADKNRFGATYELGLFEMSAGGLRGGRRRQSELSSPTGPRQGPEVLHGQAILEGSRPLLVEVQALAPSLPQWGAPAHDHRHRLQPCGRCSWRCWSGAWGCT